MRMRAADSSPTFPSLTFPSLTSANMTIRTRRAYEDPGQQDGARYLVDRLWPRGVSKERLRLDGWAREAAPSDELRRWFDHDAERWEEFSRRYHAELDERPEAWLPLLEAAREGDLTLVYGARDTQRNNAVALAEYLRNRRA